MTLNDRFIKGLIAGVIAAIAMNIINWLTHNVFKFSEMHILDFASILIHGSKPMNLGETLFALVGQIGFAGFMGIVFAYLIKYLNRSNYLLKAIVFSLFIWFSTYAVTILFGKLKHIDIATSLTNLAATLVYAIVLTLVLYRLEIKYPNSVSHIHKNVKKTMKYRVIPSPARKIENKDKKIHFRKPFKTK